MGKLFRHIILLSWWFEGKSMWKHENDGKRFVKWILLLLLSYLRAEESSILSGPQYFSSFLSSFSRWFSDDNAISINYCFFRCVFVGEKNGANGEKKEAEEEESRFRSHAGLMVVSKKRFPWHFLATSNKQLETGMRFIYYRDLWLLRSATFKHHFSFKWILGKKKKRKK